MKLEHLQGKTVEEIEREIGQQVYARQGKGPGLWLVLGLVIVLCLYLFYTAWQQQEELGELQALNDALTVENNALMVENDILQQKTNLPVASESPQTGQGQGFQGLPQSDRYIYYEVKPHDTLGKISLLFFNQDDYAKQLAQINGLSMTTTLRVGQVIKVPKDMMEPGE